MSSRAVIASVIEGEDISHEEVQKLLERAEIRLKKTDLSLDTNHRLTQSSLPKLDIGAIDQPYMRSNRGICRVDSTCLVEKAARDLADQPKKAKVISVEKKKLAEVCLHLRSRFLYHGQVSCVNLNLSSSASFD